MSPSLKPSDATSSRRVTRVSLSAHIAKALREDIYFGRLRPGTHLAQQQLCEDFGTSRMPVRDALRELVRDGLLIQDDALHTVVAPLTRRDILDGFVIEGTLAGLAAQRAAKQADADDLATLTALHEEMRATDDLAVMADLNWQFHRYINRLAHSPKLIAALRNVSMDVPRDFLAHVPSWADRSNQEHARILDALRRGDGETAGAVMVEHISASGEGLVHYLTTKGLRLDE